MESEPVDPRL
ncbi:MAG: hypothetical protein LC713_06175 [Actinobacteria bacterium]|nr:hypothetical protein [Actinomycetota bacterium]